MSFTDTISGQTLDIDLSKIGKTDEKKTETLTKLCTDIFLIVIRMREAEDLGKPAALRKLIIHYLDLFKKNCRSMGTPSSVTTDAIYALVAMLDETVMSVPGECRNFWVTNPIQLELFGDNLAGEEFYRKLEKLMEEPEKMKEVLEIYYLCLCLGFEGKYKLGNSDERDDIIDRLARMLLKVGKRASGGLSPHGKRSISRRLLKTQTRKIMPLWAVGVVAFLLLCGCWGVMYFLTGQSLEKILSILQ
jgi:type VI secretion system protein ImpK